jgi:hypothetical protein
LWTWPACTFYIVPSPSHLHRLSSGNLYTVSGDRRNISLISVETKQRKQLLNLTLNTIRLSEMVILAYSWDLSILFYLRMPSSGMWRRVDLVWTVVSEQRIASILE